uniref:Uncharacterized protein n=1 Tax=Oryza meridionalis TaxID=40149 RepID=A0A0E0F363_9ORYZ
MAVPKKPTKSATLASLGKVAAAAAAPLLGDDNTGVPPTSTPRNADKKVFIVAAASPVTASGDREGLGAARPIFASGDGDGDNKACAKKTREGLIEAGAASSTCTPHERGARKSAGSAAADAVKLAVLLASPTARNCGITEGVLPSPGPRSSLARGTWRGRRRRRTPSRRYLVLSALAIIKHVVLVDKTSPKGCTNSPCIEKRIISPWLGPELGTEEEALLRQESKANEQVLERNGTFEEDRILCEMEQVGSAYESLEWKCNFSKYYESFKTLVNKVKRWKTETRAVRRENLLNFFGDYKESEDIFSFLRICAAAWVCTHDEIAAFHPTADGLTIEQVPRC